MNREDVQFLDEVVATFRPVVTDDLKPEARPAIGRRGRFCATQPYDSGPYAGQIAMMPIPPQPYDLFGFASCPLCDLDEIELERRYDLDDRSRVKRQIIVTVIQTDGSLKPEGATLLTVPAGETWKILEVKPGPGLGEMRMVVDVVETPKE